MSGERSQVVATYSRRMSLRLQDGTEVYARIQGKKLKPVCGDYVTAHAIDNESDWLITDIHDRRSALTRPNRRGQTETLASNFELLVVVAAVTPQPDWFVVDRYLSAAENLAVPAAVVFNKIDLGVSDDIQATLSEYEGLGYAVVRCAAKSALQLDDVKTTIGDRTAIIVGQSGVGKSSIINALLGGDAQRTAAISSKTREGRHTTANSVMLELPGGGRVIDSPGVRDYAPAITSVQEAIRGFREIEEAGRSCRFADCRHRREPDCAVKLAVHNGAIGDRRYESYKRLLRLATDDVNA